MRSLLLAALLLSPAALAGGVGGPPPSSPGVLSEGKTWLLAGAEMQGREVLYSVTVSGPPSWDGKYWNAPTTLGRMAFKPAGLLIATVEGGESPDQLCFAMPDGKVYRGLLFSGTEQQQAEQLERYRAYEQRQIAAGLRPRNGQVLQAWGKASGVGTCELQSF